MRTIVRSSWQRSLSLKVDPDQAQAAAAFGTDDLREQRGSSPLRLVLPVLDRLLVGPAADTGLLVAIGDEAGRLLWVLGDHAARRRAEAIGFADGADWSEAAVGTSAPGTALVTGQGVQIRGDEHFSRSVHPWSCTAVPLRDPRSGELLGVIDLTGDDRAVAQHSMALVRAAAAAAEYELMAHREPARLHLSAAPLRLSEASCSCSRSGYRCERCGSPAAAHLMATAPGQALLTVGGAGQPLRARHAEILLLLADAPGGMASSALADALGTPDAELADVSLRAEIVRLRRVLGGLQSGIDLLSRPYRLSGRLQVDALEARAALLRGDPTAALDQVRGDLLPGSEARGVRALRFQLDAQLRDAVLSAGESEDLGRYLGLPVAAEDVDAWRLALRILPPDSPRRAAVVAHLERLERED